MAYKQSADQRASLRSVCMNDNSKIIRWAGFLQFYKAHKHTDIILKVGNSKFPCHRVVLASASQYFDGMFSSNMQEGRAHEVELQGIKAESLSLILDFIYSAEVQITTENVQSLVQAADQLLVMELVEHCERFMVKECCAGNCLSLYKLGKLYRLGQLERAAYTVMRRHFSEVSRSGDFLNMSVEELIEYISDSALLEPVEDIVFEGVVSWINFNRQERSSLFTNIIPHIRLPLCSKAYLCEQVLLNPLMCNTECLQYLKEAFRFHMLPAKQHQISTPRTQPRYAASTYATQYLVLVGGKCEGVLNNDIYTLKTDNTAWELMASLPPNLTGREWFSAVGVHNGIILTGGRCSNTYLNIKDCWLLDVKRQWKALSEMNTARSGHDSVVHNECVYVFGGYGNSCYKSAEMYNQVTNQWTPLPDMPTDPFGALPVSYKNYIYVFGGAEYDWSVNTFAYNTEESKWEQFQDMPQAGFVTGGGLVNDKVYVVFEGGFCLSYDLLLDTWTELSPPRCNHYLGAAVLWKGNILMCGGHDDENNPTDTTLVEEYDPEQDEWTDCQTLQLPKPLQHHHLLSIST